jgi:two-component system cell cycle sensor histidine kinase/response regulator CckA
MDEELPDKKKEYKNAAVRYGIALISFVVLFLIDLILQYYSKNPNLALLIALALIIPSWYGGKGPGLLVILLIEIVTIFKNLQSPEMPIGNLIFGNISGLVICVVVVMLVSSRRNFEINLKQQRELWHVTLSSIGDAVIATDIGGKINFINPIAETLTGWTIGEASGRPLSDVFKLIHEVTRQPVENPVSKALREKTVSEFVSDTVLIARDNTEIPIEENGAPIRAANNEIIGVIIAFRDIRERKQLIESDKRLQQSQKMEAIGTLTGGVAHDFNNLLTAILGNTQLALIKIYAQEAVQNHLREIEEAAKRAAALTRQLLAFSRRQPLERRSVNLNETIAEISKLLKRIIGEDVEVLTKYAEDLSMVLIDQAQIEQVIMNLAVNARDAMPGGGRLSIETGNIELDASYCRQYPYVKPGKYVQIIISDTGSGMDEITQTHIFEPFFTTKDIGKGTGLGLSMAYGIVKQHDGNINVYSEPGHGSTFKIFLPVADKTVEEEALKSIKPAAAGGSETILIAEDEEILRTLAADILQGFGYTVLVAKNGQEAVGMYADNRERINLLLFDVVMPLMGGAEAFERISAEASGAIPPVIFMTGYGSEMVEINFVKQNAFVDGKTATIIQKPYSIDGLGQKVREILDRQEK